MSRSIAKYLVDTEDGCRNRKQYTDWYSNINQPLPVTPMIVTPANTGHWTEAFWEAYEVYSKS